MGMSHLSIYILSAFNRDQLTHRSIYSYSCMSLTRVVDAASMIWLSFPPSNTSRALRTPFPYYMINKLPKVIGEDYTSCEKNLYNQFKCMLSVLFRLSDEMVSQTITTKSEKSVSDNVLYKSTNRDPCHPIMPCFMP